jgi:putative FmdB family regulatory protein
MPIHTYYCGHCGHSFERFEPIHEERPKRCPECGRKARLGVGRTGMPVLKEGVGGFYKPTLPERTSSE